MQQQQPKAYWSGCGTPLALLGLWRHFPLTSNETGLSCSTHTLKPALHRIAITVLLLPDIMHAASAFPSVTGLCVWHALPAECADDVCQLCHVYALLHLFACQSIVKAIPVSDAHAWVFADLLRAHAGWFRQKATDER